MDALDCANFSSERAWRTESSPTDSTYFTATHHAEPITAASPFTVPDDFSNRANFTNAIADADCLNRGRDRRVFGGDSHLRARAAGVRDNRPSGRFASRGRAAAKGGLGLTQ
jgi:hypothetical protein